MIRWLKSNSYYVGILLSQETMDIAPWTSVCGGTAAPVVAVEPNPRTAGPVAVAECEDSVVRRRWLLFLSTAPLFSALDGRPW